MFRLSFLVKYIALVICFLTINYFVFGMAVWSTMSHMCTMPCLPTLIEITWHSRALPGKFSWKVCVYTLSLVLSFMFLTLIYGVVCNSFFKESSIEERGHAEKLMEYQVINFTV